MGLFNRCIVCAPNQANKTGSIFWFNEWDRWATMYSRLSTILLVLGLVITFQCLTYTEAGTDDWPLRRRKSGKKSLRNKLVWFLKLMTKQKILKTFHLECLFIQPLSQRDLFIKLNLKNPKCSRRKNSSQDLPNFYNKNDSKVI
mgnify:CR=1 FL=1